jgi:hypothetical protein
LTGRRVEHHARAGLGGGDADVADFSGDERAELPQDREQRRGARFSRHIHPRKPFSIMEFNPTAAQFT